VFIGDNDIEGRVLSASPPRSVAPLAQEGY